MTLFDEAYQNTRLLFGFDPTPELIAAVRRHDIQGRALELGCGDGRDTLHILREGFSVTALDRSPPAIDHLLAREEMRPFLPDKLTARTADILHDSWGDEPYDFIYSITVLDNFTTEEQTVLETRMLDALRPGGRLYLTVHTEEDDGYRGAGSEFAPEIRHYYRKGELLMRLINKGRVLFYQEAREEDLEHGSPHFHGFAHILIQKNEEEQPCC